MSCHSREVADILVRVLSTMAAILRSDKLKASDD